ncbi:MAG: hypothetical protein MUO78_03800 [candidate division Zixibacteria bacterium]|nr:hypothetical protein [candidate division Zixibacteria bacterium]
MTEPKIVPHKITKPIQLLAVWLAGLVLLVGAFLTAAKTITTPPWLSVMFGITAITIVPLFIILIFLMQTKFRIQLQDDPYYAEYLKRQETEFKDFHPENIISKSKRQFETISKNGSIEESEQERIKRYQHNQGLFLIHTWRPSRTPGQVADIAISLQQHEYGPLSEGKVKSIEYYLGPKFFERPVVKTYAKNNFRLDVSAYAPMLCLAKVNFTDNRGPLVLERYINF